MQKSEEEAKKEKLRLARELKMIEKQKREAKEIKRKAALSMLNRKYKLDNPEKTQAHIIINRLIKKGLIFRGICEKCGEGDAQAHHDDYNFPLKIRWLCRTHHGEFHRNHKYNKKTLTYKLK